MPSRRRSPRKKTSKKGSRKGLKLLSIKRSPKKDKKYMATFSRNGRIKKFTLELEDTRITEE